MGLRFRVPVVESVPLGFRMGVDHRVILAAKSSAFYQVILHMQFSDQSCRAEKSPETLASRKKTSVRDRTD
jgi:hypothetical protein